jgi:hypothetical protein
MSKNACFKLLFGAQSLAQKTPVQQPIHGVIQTKAHVVLRLCRHNLLVLLASFIAVQFMTAPSSLAQQSGPSQFLDLVKHAIDSATTVRIFRLQKPLLADDPRLTIRDIPEPSSERRLDKADQRLRSILDILSRKNSYDFELMLSTRTRAQFGIMFYGPSGRSALLFPLPTASQSAAVTTRFVAEDPLGVDTSTAVLTDTTTLLRDMAGILEGGNRDQ